MFSKKIFLILIVFFFLSGCSSKQTKHFSQEAKDKIIEKSKEYAVKEYQEGKVPFYQYVKMTGKITQDDGGGVIQKGTRFVLNLENFKVQVINQTDTTFHKQDVVTVYGEYYGIVQGEYIENKEK